MDGLSFQSNSMVTSPDASPFNINFDPSSANFAVTPGEVERIFKVALTSNPSLASSSNSISLPLLTTLFPDVDEASDPYLIGKSTDFVSEDLGALSDIDTTL